MTGDRETPRLSPSIASGWSACPKIAHGEGRYVTAPTQAEDICGALEAVRETLIEMNGDLAPAR